MITCPACGRGGTYIDEATHFTRNWSNNDVKIRCVCKYCGNVWANVYTLAKSEAIL